MPDIATIATALSSLKTATEITKLLRESDLSFERAELKLKLADLIEALADAKTELLELQDVVSQKDKKILELEAAFQTDKLLVRQYDAYYETDESGKPNGIPYCLRCWENDHRRRQLVDDAKDHFLHVCTSCGHRYSARSTPSFRGNA